MCITSSTICGNNRAPPKLCVSVSLLTDRKRWGHRHLGIVGINRCLVLMSLLLLRVSKMKTSWFWSSSRWWHPNTQHLPSLKLGTGFPLRIQLRNVLFHSSKNLCYRIMHAHKIYDNASHILTLDINCWILLLLSLQIEILIWLRAPGDWTSNL